MKWSSRDDASGLQILRRQRSGDPQNQVLGKGSSGHPRLNHPLGDDPAIREADLESSRAADRFRARLGQQRILRHIEPHAPLHFGSCSVYGGRTAKIIDGFASRKSTTFGSRAMVMILKVAATAFGFIGLAGLVLTIPARLSIGLAFIATAVLFFALGELLHRIGPRQ